MESLIHLYGPLPPLKLRAKKLVDATAADKKNIGGVRRFVLPVGIGDAGVARFLIEFFRINPRSFFGMSNAQTASLVSVLLGIALLWRVKSSSQKTAKAT